MGIEKLEVRLSGGSGNTDPAASTGGIESTTAALSQSATSSTTIPGVTVYDAAGNTVGTGTLTYTFVDTSLKWTPPGGVIGVAVNVGTSGRYLIRGVNPTDGYVIVDSASASLSIAANFTASVTVANQTALLLPAVSKDTAFAGATEYFLYYLHNAGATTIKSASITLATDTTGVDTLSISKIATVNTTELQAAASGHTYSAVGVAVDLGDLAAGDYWGVWVKRVIPVGTSAGTASNPFKFTITSLT